MNKKLIIILVLLSAYSSLFAFAEESENPGAIKGAVEWESFQINAAVSMDLAANGIRLPAGRTQAETLLKSHYLNLIQGGLLGLQIDSSSTLSDLINRRELSLTDLEALSLRADSVAAALTPDMKKISSSHTISMTQISSVLLKHSRPSAVTRILNPVSTANYTGIVIIATEELPVHGMRSSALAIPCLFPKIWDSEMNLIYERNMLEIGNTTMVHYSSSQNIFQRNPSGLTPELQKIAGERPLRIFARGVFGIKPTDLIIERSDALLILSSEENRRLLTQGKVVFVMDDSVLRYEFNGE